MRIGYVAAVFGKEWRDLLSILESMFPERDEMESPNTREGVRSKK